MTGCSCPTRSDHAAASASSILVLEFLPQPITVRNVQRQHFFKLFQELAGGLGVVTVALKLGNDLPLPGNVLLTLGDVPFGLG